MSVPLLLFFFFFFFFFTRKKGILFFFACYPLSKFHLVFVLTFVFCLQTTDQQEWMKKYGKVAFLDSTHGTNMFQMPLYSIVGNAEGRQGKGLWSLQFSTRKNENPMQKMSFHSFKAPYNWQKCYHFLHVLSRSWYGWQSAPVLTAIISFAFLCAGIPLLFGLCSVDAGEKRQEQFYLEWLLDKVWSTNPSFRPRAFMLDKASTEHVAVEESLKRRSRAVVEDFVWDFPQTPSVSDERVAVARKTLEERQAREKHLFALATGATW